MNSGGILSGPTIANEVREGHIRIEPGFDESRINPASYDLTLGSKVAVYRDSVYFVHKLGQESPKLFQREKLPMRWEPPALRPDRAMCSDPEIWLDSRKKNEVHQFTMEPERGWLLKPGIGYLMHTAERIWTERYVPVLDGKSSLGRLFMTAHVTAGYGDPGFDGQYTLEVVVTHPVIVYPGMRFCQIRFHELAGPVLSYATKGHYVGELAEGPIPSMSWKQFEEQQDGAK